MTAPSARAAAEHAARESHGRLVALLAAAHGDLALAEDAVATAFERALATWPDAGIPQNPEGWLLTVARNAERDVWKSSAVRAKSPLTDASDSATSTWDDLDPDAIPDKRLALLFVCAHPALDPAIRTPLMLQVVLGFEAAQIAAAFGVPATAMAQRLVRAKRRVRDTRIPFNVPERSAIAGRWDAVLEAVYGCYAIAWRDADGLAHDEADSMAGEALYLAVTLADLVDEPEAWGLAALVALSLSRARTRVGPFVPLDEQDPAGWDSELIAEGERYLRRAGGGAPGRFQLEAAIQAVHVDRARSGVTDWTALNALYDALLIVAPTLGARVAAAAVAGRAGEPSVGLRRMDRLGDEATGFLPFHAARADLLARAGKRSEAAVEFRLAAALASGSERDYLSARAASL